MPHWTENIDLAPSSNYYHWLKDTESLTKKIKQQCTNHFSVKLLSQSEQIAYQDEYKRLALNPREKVIVREVVLYCGDIPWVFARTIIPLTSLSGEAAQLSNLNTKPLGEVLFSSPQTTRKMIEIADLKNSDLLFQQAIQCLKNKPAHLWARRTLFLFYNKPLLVNEIFLPQCGKN